MFVRQKKYDAMRAKAAFYEMLADKLDKEADRLLGKWDDLVARINKKGGEDFLENGIIHPPQQFTLEEVNALLMLAHPDKHGGKESATRMTRRLLEVRETLQNNK